MSSFRACICHRTDDKRAYNNHCIFVVGAALA